MGALQVVAGLLLDRDGRAFMAKRLEGKTRPGLWEFPGGKLNEGETARAAMRREWEEETGSTVSVENCIARCTFDLEVRFEISLYVVHLTATSERPFGAEGQQVGWFHQDIAIVSMPLVPSCYLFYPTVKMMLRGMTDAG